MKYTAEQTMTVIYALSNKCEKAVKVKLDLSGVANAFKSHKCRKLSVKPNSTEFLAMFEEDKFKEDEIVLGEEWEIKLMENDISPIVADVNKLFDTKKTKKERTREFAEDE